MRGPGIPEYVDEAMDVSASLWSVLAERFPERASYAVSLAYRMRYVMQFNAREAMPNGGHIHVGLANESAVAQHCKHCGTYTQKCKIIIQRSDWSKLKLTAEGFSFNWHQQQGVLDKPNRLNMAKRRRDRLLARSGHGPCR
jgi:hypothetical protein